MMTADDVLHLLTTSPLCRTADLPADRVGIYALADHEHRLRYIGMTEAPAESFRKRIHGRHRTGSESHSHMFSRMYNTGRMWRDRTAQRGHPDGDLAKALRNAFVAEHCRAVVVAIDPQSQSIPALERAVIDRAPREMTAWNGRASLPLEEPAALVEAMMDALGYGPDVREALTRQARRHAGLSAEASSIPTAPSVRPTRSPLPEGPFRFAALDVETANHDRGSICQIGIAFVRPDRSITTWSTYVDPEASYWAFTGLHGISAATVAGAPTIGEVLPRIEAALEGLTVYQHSGFDRSAIRAACARIGRGEPDWDWQDSVWVARRAWPALRGAGGHGLASLKRHLGLIFEHHDAEEDARAAAEVVLHTEAGTQINLGRAIISAVTDDDDFDLIEEDEELMITTEAAPVVPAPAPAPGAWITLGHVILTQGNITNSHIYLREFFALFPKSCVGGSNAASAASEELEIHWGDPKPVMTDLDGQKQFFRKRGWIRRFFALTGARAGDRVRVELMHPRRVRVSMVRQGA